MEAAVLGIQGRGEVHGPDGQVLAPDTAPTPAWQESMRYFRMSELTDDLFDAFRNVYLALESLLSVLEPVRVTKDRRPREREGDWFKRALRHAGELVDLEGYSKNPTGNTVHDIYDELHNRVRNRVFHAKDGLQPFLPQDLSDRTHVAEAKRRYGRLYLALAEKIFNSRFPTGGTSFSRAATQDVLKAVTQDWAVAVTGDPAPADASEQELSPNGEAIMTLPASQFADPRGDDFAAILARAAVPEITAVTPAVGRFGTVNPDGHLGVIASLEGRLTLTGFDRCEFLISLGMTGRQARKTLYAT